MYDETAPHVLFISNGHGEDEVGARVGEVVVRLRPDLRLAALPVVGLGRPYERVGIPRLEPRRELPSGGLLMHSLPLFLADLQAGFLSLTLGQWQRLLFYRCASVVTVGDVYAQLLGSLTRARHRFVVQTLVSAYHAQGLAFSTPNRMFMERITIPEQLLMSRARAVYVRDGATETALHDAGLKHARFLGNPIADRLEGRVPASLAGLKVVGLLPGSRSYRHEALAKMIEGIALLRGEGVVGAVAWIGGDLEPPVGWEAVAVAPNEEGLVSELRKAGTRVLVYRARFADVLRAARVVVGTSGTANEQAVAVGRPVVAFPVPPYYSSTFLQNQKRLLGPALSVVGASDAEIAGAVQGWLDDPATAERLAGQGRARIGGPGGSEAIARDVLRRLESYGAIPEIPEGLSAGGTG
ncbi:MAG TPA: lipid-A-disaccharide synthase-related protein [Trueperaceae bacterium]